MATKPSKSRKKVSKPLLRHISLPGDFNPSNTEPVDYERYLAAPANILSTADPSPYVTAAILDDASVAGFASRRVNALLQIPSIRKQHGLLLCALIFRHKADWNSDDPSFPAGRSGVGVRGKSGSPRFAGRPFSALL